MFLKRQKLVLSSLSENFLRALSQCHHDIILLFDEKKFQTSIDLLEPGHKSLKSIILFVIFGIWRASYDLKFSWYISTMVSI